MHQLNNLDVVILIITALSAFIALFRGLVKEVLSVLGWVLSAVVIFYLLPILTPFAQIYIASKMMSGIVTSLVILIVFYIVWLLSTDHMVRKIRSSKLSALDRILGLLFGVFRAFLLVILFNIFVTWIFPEESKSGMFKDSKYFTFAGRFAEPIRSLIPQSTFDLIKEKTAAVNPEAKEKTKEETADQETESQVEIDELFEKLSQPQIEKIATDDLKQQNFDGYKENETDNLDRLIENTVQ